MWAWDLNEDKSDLLRSLSINRTADDLGGSSRGASPVVRAAVAAGALALGGANGWFAKPAPKPIPVAAAPVAATAPGGRALTPVSGLTASGYVVARVRATVAAEVTGRVVEVRVEEGQTVRQGQVLAVLDGALARVEAASANARANAAVASANAAQVQLAEAQRDLNRAQPLAKTGFISPSRLESTASRVSVAAAQLEVARAQVIATRSDANRAMTQLARYEIRAPFSGVVIDKAAQPGEIISPLSAGGGFTRTGICTLVDMDSLEVEVDVNEAYVGRISAGQKVEAVLDAYPDTTIPAYVIAKIPTASRDKATVRVRIDFDAKDARVLPDMAVKVTFLDKRS